MELLRPRQQHRLKDDLSQRPGKHLQQRPSTAGISPVAVIPRRVALSATVFSPAVWLNRDVGPCSRSSAALGT